MTDLCYLTDSYKKTDTSTVVSVEKHGVLWDVVLSKTIFYPEGGGQPSDKGTLVTSSGKAIVKHVRLKNGVVIHECSITGSIRPMEEATCTIDWANRYTNMRLHSAGHVIHEAIIQLYPTVIPTKGHHSDPAYLEYQGSLPIDAAQKIEREANTLVENNLSITSELVSLEQLRQRSAFVPDRLPTDKPLRIIAIGNRPPMPDGGTQVAKTHEIGPITISSIENSESSVRIFYALTPVPLPATDETAQNTPLSAMELTGLLLDAQREAVSTIETSDEPIDQLKLSLLGSKSTLSTLTKSIRRVSPDDRQAIGIVVKEVKSAIEHALDEKTAKGQQTPTQSTGFDNTMPGIRPPVGHLHIVSQAVNEITAIFDHIGFTRVRHPEVDWDWYPFESLNMPPSHPARDEWETFFIRYPGKPSRDPKRQKVVLTPHTSNGQVREMEKGILPIRMINIAKCYRRQIDVSHTPMFHQFEGLYIDTHVSIAHLKGVLTYFAQQFFGPSRKTRLRPFHFQFTEPSFEVDISCGICNGTGTTSQGSPCRLCKAGWLELGGAGMVHPVVLKNGGIDPNVYSGFAFGWGVERTYMMKSGTQLDDIRLLYSNDVRFLEQF